MLQNILIFLSTASFFAQIILFLSIGGILSLNIPVSWDIPCNATEHPDKTKVDSQYKVYSRGRTNIAQCLNFCSLYETCSRIAVDKEKGLCILLRKEEKIEDTLFDNARFKTGGRKEEDNSDSYPANTTVSALFQDVVNYTHCLEMCWNHKIPDNCDSFAYNQENLTCELMKIETHEHEEVDSRLKYSSCLSESLGTPTSEPFTPTTRDTTETTEQHRSSFWTTSQACQTCPTQCPEPVINTQYICTTIFIKKSNEKDKLKCPQSEGPYCSEKKDFCKPFGKCNEHPKNGTCPVCECNDGWEGEFCEKQSLNCTGLNCSFSDCGEIKISVPHASSGVYVVSPKGRPISVWCDMDTDSGGWTVFQRRQNGSVNFTKDWNSYKEGFGSIEAEHWLGNRNLYELTGSGVDLLIELGGDKRDSQYPYSTGCMDFAMYSDFLVESEEDLFGLGRNLKFLRGSCGDSLSEQKGCAFSTIDQDNDDNGNEDCARIFMSGWWFKDCTDSNLNGIYYHTFHKKYRDKANQNIAWITYSIKDKWDFSFLNVEMKIRNKKIRLRQDILDSF